MRTGAAPRPVAPDDDVLLARYAHGDSRAAKELTRRLTPRVYGLALRLLGNPTEAEDVTQEAMLRLWRMAPDWQPGTAQVATWLYRVTLNLCRDLQRGRHRRRSVALDAVPEPVDPSLSAADRLQERARSDALQAALLGLPDRQRQAVVLRHLEDLSNPQIAEIMEIGVEAVESLTARGKRALASALARRQAELGYQDE